MKVDIFNTKNKYDLIYTDPPWEIKKSGKTKLRPNSSGGNLDYPTLNLQEIINIHSYVFNNLVNEKHNVFMWTIDKYLFKTEGFMRKLGYQLHTRIIWHKLTGHAPAYTVRFTNEYLLWFYKKGNIILPDKKVRGKYKNFIKEKSKKHSQKPEQAYLMLEDMFKNANKIELFARNIRSGWDCWGNEI